jgi:hypothetical protein
VATYGEAATRLLSECRACLDGNLPLADFKAAVWRAAEQVVLVEECDLRAFLQIAEGRLDMIEHTSNGDDVFEATVPIAREVETRVRAYLAS